MKKLVRAGTLILFAGLIFVFVMYRSGGFNRGKGTVLSTETEQVQNEYVNPDIVSKDSTEKIRVSEDAKKPVTDIDPVQPPLSYEYHISSSKSAIVHEKWDEHAAAVAKFVKQMDSIKKLDSIQRAKEWETVSPR